MGINCNLCNCEYDGTMYNLLTGANDFPTNENSLKSQQQPQPQLRPLFFEVPLEESQVFVPRNWIFSSILQIFKENIHSRGVILYGAPGTG